MSPGLCGACVNARILETRRGSTFYRCAVSDVDARFPRYPRLPVLRCSAHVPGVPSKTGDGDGVETG
jgi:hypothetical protein